MGCSTTRHEITKDVWSVGSTSTTVFVPFLRVPTNQAPRVKMSLFLGGSSNLRVNRAWRYTNDAVTWYAAEEFGNASFVGNGWSYGKRYYPVHDMYQEVEVGVLCKNDTGTATESGVVRAQIELREDGLETFGNVPGSWGTLEYELARAPVANKQWYGGVTNPPVYGDVYDVPSSPWSLAAVANTDGDPSGPGAGTASKPYWIGYNNVTGVWAVYTDTSWYTGTITVVSGTALVGGDHAIARVRVASGVATFEISFDGLRWTTLYTLSDSWLYRFYLVRAAATYTVQRETVS